MRVANCREFYSEKIQPSSLMCGIIKARFRLGEKTLISWRAWDPNVSPTPWKVARLSHSLDELTFSMLIVALLGFN